MTRNLPGAAHAKNNKGHPEAVRDELMTIAELSRRSGISEAAIRGRIAGGHWTEGIHFFRRTRRVMMDYQACMRWCRERSI